MSIYLIAITDIDSPAADYNDSGFSNLKMNFSQFEIIRFKLLQWFRLM